MNTSNTKALVWVLPNPSLFKETNPHDHPSCISTEYSDSVKGEISLKDWDGQRKFYKVDEFITDSRIDLDLAANEREKVVKQAIKGYNTACLFSQIGGYTYASQKRQLEKKLLLQELGNKIKPSTTIEYVYFCVDDDNCYDMREEKLRTGKSVLQNGIDSWLKETDRVMDIWEDMRREATQPHVIKIRLTDHLTKRFGCLYIFDLLHPRFLPLTPQSSYPNIYYSFKKIRDLVDLVLETDRTSDHYATVNDNVLTSLLAPFISGSGKLVMFTYLTECPKRHGLETVMALDFIKKMRCIKATYLPNEPINGVKAANEILEKICNECQQNLREAKLCIDNLLKEKAKAEFCIASLEDKIEKNPLKKENAELHKKLKTVGKLFKRIVVGVRNGMNQMKISASHRFDRLEKEKKRLEYENSQLLLNIGYLKDELSTEYAIAVKEKNELRAYIKVLQETEDRLYVV